MTVSKEVRISSPSLDEGILLASVAPSRYLSRWNPYNRDTDPVFVQHKNDGKYEFELAELEARQYSQIPRLQVPLRVVPLSEF
jgi:hypothetical protein